MAEVVDEPLPRNERIGLLVGPGDAGDQSSERDAEDGGRGGAGGAAAAGFWRTMPHNGMTPHTSGTSLSAQARYAAGTREILGCFLGDRPIRDEYLIVKGGALAGTGARSCSAGSAGRRASQEEDSEPSS